MVDNNVLVTLISVVGAVITTWLTVKYKDRLMRKPEKDRPVDRMEKIFDGYEKLIKQQQTDIDYKGRSLKGLSELVDSLESELAEAKRGIEIYRTDLAQAKEQNKLLTEQLSAMKKEYTTPIT